MPGMFDIHTHYDLELEVAPGLPESTRHGTTSVVISNCSLGLAFGNQREGDTDPIVDCYARVENIPKPVLRACADKVTWTNPQEYIDHLESINMKVLLVTLLKQKSTICNVAYAKALRWATRGFLLMPYRFIIWLINRIVIKPFRLNSPNIMRSSN